MKLTAPMVTALYRIKDHSWSGASKRTVEALMQRELLEIYSGRPVLTAKGKAYFDGPKKYIAYFATPMWGGTSPEGFNSLDEIKDAFETFEKDSGFEACYGSVYGWSLEAWAEALEYEGVGVPFDYPQYMIEHGPRGAVRIVNA